MDSFDLISHKQSFHLGTKKKQLHGVGVVAGVGTKKAGRVNKGKKHQAKVLNQILNNDTSNFLLH